MVLVLLTHRNDAGAPAQPRHSLSNCNHWPCERRLEGSLGGAITEASSPLLRQLNNSLPRTPRSETLEPETMSPKEGFADVIALRISGRGDDAGYLGGSKYNPHKRETEGTESENETG